MYSTLAYICRTLVEYKYSKDNIQRLLWLHNSERALN